MFEMNKNIEELNSIDQNRLKELKGNETLFRSVIRIAQYESEIDLGVNPRSFEQANVGNLSENDFEYIRRVCDLAEKRLQDLDWLKKTLDKIENKYEVDYVSTWGIKFDDELFKAGRGILESSLEEIENERT